MTESEPEIAKSLEIAKPVVRKGIMRLLVVTLIGVALAASFWDKISLWWSLSQTRELFHSHRDEQALQLLRKTLLSHGPKPEITLQLARAHRRLGNLPIASMLLQTAAKQGAESEKVELEQKLLAVQSGQIRGFDKEFSSLLVKAADKADVFEAYILGLFANLRTDDAFGLLDGWAKSSPADPMPRFLDAYLWHGIGRLPDAAKSYRKGLELAPHMTTMRRRLAQVLFESGDYRAAREELERCRNEANPSAEVLVLLAQCAFAENDNEGALAEADHAIEVEPSHLGARRLTGQIRLANGDFQSALTDLEYVSKRTPDDLVAREALARTLQSLDRSVEAKQHFDFVSAANKEQTETGRLIRKVLGEPTNPELRFEIGARLMQFGNPEGGVKWLRTVLEIDPNHNAANAMLADFYRSSGSVGPPR